MLGDLARFLDTDDFEQLGRRLELSSGDEMGLLVSGEAGSLDYRSQEHGPRFRQWSRRFSGSPSRTA
jgi:hypothetical protein